MRRVSNIGCVVLSALFMIASITYVVPESQGAGTYGGDGDDVVNSAQTTPGGGFIVAGSTTSFGAGESDAWVMKFDITGMIEWQKAYGGPASDSAQVIQQANNGGSIGYIVAGHTNSLGSEDIRVMKLNAAGTVIWEKVYGTSTGEESLHALERTLDGGYMVAGNTSTNEGDYLLMKLDGDGNIVWQKRYGEANVDTLTSFCMAVDGGYIMAGDSWSFGGNKDFWVVKVNEDGGIVWQKRYGLREFVPEGHWNNNIDDSPSIQSIPAGYIIAGRSDPSLGPNPLLWVFKLDFSGIITWQRFYARIRGLNVTSILLTSDPDNDYYILTGHTDSAGSAVGHDWILKLDEYGNKVWWNEYWRWNYPFLDEINTLIADTDGGYMAAGNTHTWNDSWALSSNAWLLKLDANGLIADCAAIWPLGASLIPEEVDAYAHHDTTVTDVDATLVVRVKAVEVYDSAAKMDDGCNPPSIPVLINLPKTGQTTSYYSGDDGDLRAGITWPAPRFTDHGDGTLTDRLTGLMWLKDANCAHTIGYNPDSSGLGRMQWASALDFVAAINAGSYTECSGGHHDWRLPNINELGSLANLGQPDMAAWLIGQGFENVQSSYGYYWSSTTHFYYGDGALQLAVSDGGYAWNLKTDADYMWPVRAGQPDYPDATFPANVWKTGQAEYYHPGDDGDRQYGIAWPVSMPPRFTDHGNGTVTDHLTGLMWLKDADCFGAADLETTYETIDGFNLNPEAYGCTGPTAGYDDWRLSNRTELLSLIDRSQATHPLPPGHPFVNISPGQYRSSNTYAEFDWKEWQVDMFYYGMPAYSARSAKPFWPVRGGTHGSACAADLDKDGDVDGADLSVFIADYMNLACDAGEACAGDFDEDGDVDDADLSRIALEMGSM